MKRFATIAITVAAIAAAVAATTCGTIAAVIAAVAVAIVAAAAVVAIKGEREKCATMIEAMRNNDFTMQFHDGDNEMNEMLRSLAAMMKSARIDASRRERYYQTIINQVNAGIIAIDGKGSVSICNDRALSMLGLHHAASIDAITRVIPQFADVIAVAEPGDTPVVETAEGKSVTVSVSRISQGDNVTTICVLTDIHNALNVREVEAWHKLTRVLTHEIINSIAPIHALSDSLLHDTSGTAHDKIEVIRDTAAALMQFTESYRKFSSIPSPERRLLYVADIIDEATTLMHEPLAAAAVNVAVESDLIVQADRVLIVRVVVNLLRNAIEAGATAIGIEARSQSDDTVRIDISDNGAPVDAACRDRIFVPFFTTKPSGSGIGLAVARRVMSLHGGGISLIQPAAKPYAKTFRLTLE